MKPFFFILTMFIYIGGYSQTYRMVALGTSTAAGLSTSSPDSSWVRRFNYHYKYQLGLVDTTYNLGVSGKTLYNAMPSSYSPPAGRPLPDPVYNVTRANSLLNGLSTPSHGVVIINFPSGGYDTYSIPEIMNALQIMYDSAVKTGNRSFVTTTQPRTSEGFNTSAIKRKLADLKDSIINRFGVANTINFWDGLYNPVDTTILSTYSSGDNIHFNNAGHRVLFERVKAKNVFNLPPVNYRSNVSPTGLWNNATSWEIFNGSSWVPAQDPPSMGSGTITIVSGDSIRMNSFAEADQLIIENGGILSIFNNTSVSKSIFTLNDGSGDDLINNGKLYISANGIVNGNGFIRNGNSALFTIRNRGVLEANGANNGTLWVNNTGIIRNRTFTNNKLFVLQDFTLNLINSHFINNDSMSIIGSGITYIADSTLKGGFFTNAETGIIQRESSSGSTNFNQSVRFINNGRLKGIGEIILNNIISNTGSVEPGNPAGKLTVNSATVHNLSPLIDLEISSTGGVQGINYDHLTFSTVSPVTRNISNARLRVTDKASDPVGTVYTLISPASGTITGNFASVELSASLSGLNYNNGNFITVTKTSSLPVTWGEFTATIIERNVLLKWNTIQEINTEHFIIEHSTDGRYFNSIGKVNASGNSTVKVDYTFTHYQPDVHSSNYYRLKQVDKDGKYNSSKISMVSFTSVSAYVSGLSTYVFNTLQFEVKKDNVQIVLRDMNGKLLNNWKLGAGSHRLNIDNVSRGSYLMIVYHGNRQVETYRLIKK